MDSSKAVFTHFTIRGGSRISRWGGAPTLIGWGANLRHRCFSVKTYVKTKEFGPVGGGTRRKLLYVDPPLTMYRTSRSSSKNTSKAVADSGFPVGGRRAVGGGADLQRGHFLVKMYAKTKELDSIGGGTLVAPPWVRQ